MDSLLLRLTRPHDVIHVADIVDRCLIVVVFDVENRIGVEIKILMNCAYLDFPFNRSLCATRKDDNSLPDTTFNTFLR